MSFDLKDFKLKWQGSWRDRTQFIPKNDIVAWKGKSYRCIKIVLLHIQFRKTLLVNTNNYSLDPT